MRACKDWVKIENTQMGMWHGARDVWNEESNEELIEELIDYVVFAIRVANA